MLAIVGGVGDRHRFSVMFNSITSSANARLSPGIILMAEIISDCAKRGLASYDLGAGQAPYKEYFCWASVQRFDSFVPCSPRGHAMAMLYKTADALPRSLKTSPALMSTLHAVRRWTARAPAAID